jgi:ATP-dependent exoDNAse (exonuclease V) beta subunit
VATASEDSNDANSNDVEGADFDGDTRSGLPMSQSQTNFGVRDASHESARDFGKLVHGVLERIDFAAQPSAAELRAWCEHLAPLHVEDNEDEAAKLAQSMIERLLALPRGRQMAQAAAFHRELEFLLAWPPERYLRGYIDCLYQDASGDWRIVDYKTNNVTAAECEREARSYEMQLYVYAMAAERALGVPPVELVLYFMKPGVEHVLAWNDEARRRGAQMVNDAIDNLLRERSL